ncbi:hypothetical protein E2C01_036718 [Portunus trituberculatus]|uniref:Uncharacterized protein n=1 Tax=Portunus trituberculatus TaxID=210409 RepID=A0A5B7F7F7_PORTR|nr:hypothetical protein [Portunus trituberculatus]
MFELRLVEVEDERANEVGHVQKAKKEKERHLSQEPINTVRRRGGSRRLPEWKVTVRDWCLSWSIARSRLRAAGRFLQRRCLKLAGGRMREECVERREGVRGAEGGKEGWCEGREWGRPVCAAMSDRYTVAASLPWADVPTCLPQSSPSYMGVDCSPNLQVQFYFSVFDALPDRFHLLIEFGFTGRGVICKTGPPPLFCAETVVISVH